MEIKNSKIKESIKSYLEEKRERKGRSNEPQSNTDDKKKQKRDLSK